ncbi:MAG: hypothetical protein ASUL_08269 [Candidatus Aramenus sulfurataquae]|uniref:Uncharacterized protein n=1 Tax=Candidatus Aramenus sulfurataquae TaxID=1326980 RepID=W7KKE3_9CREN|nr:MAG: hypothetical protein ASUL_08269 [Candidatus Aramenus sulfurataquae]
MTDFLHKWRGFNHFVRFFLGLLNLFGRFSQFEEVLMAKQDLHGMWAQVMAAYSLVCATQVPSEESHCLKP